MKIAWQPYQRTVRPELVEGWTVRALSAESPGGFVIYVFRDIQCWPVRPPFDPSLAGPAARSG